MITLVREREAQIEEATTSGDREHIICDCRPKVAYCGAYDDTPVSDREVDGSECSECYRVWRDKGCPNCGCFENDLCSLCEVVEQ